MRWFLLTISFSYVLFFVLLQNISVITQIVMAKIYNFKNGEIYMELVKIENNQAVVSSRSIAEHFEKQHKHVLESIENIKAENSALTSMFYETTYKAGTGKRYKMYLMNRDGFTLLAMGFTGKKALDWKVKYIEAFNKMEKQLAVQQQFAEFPIPKDYPSALRALADQCESNQKLIAKNKELVPKAEFYDAVANSESLSSMADVAKILDMGIGRNKLFIMLRANNILQADNIPYQRYVNAGYFKVVESHYMADGNSVVAKTTYVKQRGIDYIRKLLNKQLIVNNQ